MSGTATAATAVSPGPSTSSETSGIIPPPRSTINTGVNAFNSSSNDNQWKMTETEKLSEGSGRYFGWKALTSMYLSSTTLISLVNGTEPCPDPTTSLPEEIIAWTHRDNRAKAQLGSYISMGLLSQLDATTAASMWSSITSRFEHTGAGAILVARDKIHAKFIGPSETMDDHIGELRRRRTALYSAGGTLLEEEWKAIIVKSLRHKWEKYRPMLLVVGDSEKIISFLTLEASNLESSSTSTSSETALSVNARGQKRRYNGPGCTHCGRKGHGSDNCFAPGGKMEKSAPAWYKPPANMKGSGQEANAATTTTPSTSSNQETARMTYRVSADRNHTGPILDSGSTSHMINDKAYLDSYIEFAEPLVIGSAKSGSSMRSLGSGILTLKFIRDGYIHTLTLSDVLYVPELDTDLISVSKLEDDGVHLEFKNSRCYFSKENQVFGYAERAGALYHLRSVYAQPQSAHLASAQQDLSKDLDMWHRRFGHMSEGRITSMVSHGAVSGINLVGPKPLGRCEACILAKQVASHSPARNKRASNPFDVVHSDIIFFGETSIGGAKYGLTFIDEASGYTWVYAINDKTSDTVLHHFRALDVLVETQFATRIKALHTDNGGEYVNLAMTEYLASRGIQHHTIAPHRHEMNGIAERCNRTAADAVRAMLIAAHLSHGYWAEAYYAWAYVHNRSTLSFLAEGTTPYEIIYGLKPDVGHLRVFGSVAYARVPPDSRRKLEPKSEKGILVGYYDDAAYRVMRPDHSIIKSKDVIFAEGLGSRTLTMSGSDLDLSPAGPDLDPGHVNPSDPPTDFPPVIISSPAPNDSLSTLTTPAPASIPILRRSARSDHTTKDRREGIAQELGLKHLDHPKRTANAANSPRVIAGIILPRHFGEARQSPQCAEWMEAAAYELGKLYQHEVWDEVPRPIDTHVIQGMWVFNIKEKPDGPLEYRMRWVARGDSQLESEFGEIHATSGDYTVARIICALSAAEDGRLEVNDISSAYLHSRLDLDLPIYVEYPTGFSPQTPGTVCKLKKALYGLRQGARAWQEEFQRTLSSCGFTTLVTAPSAFRRSDYQGETLAGTHVDDIVSMHKTAPNAPQAEEQRFKDDLASHYEYKSQDLTKRTKLLGWTLSVTTEYVTISVEAKIKRLAERYGLQDANPASTPMAIDALKTFASAKSEPISDSDFPYRNAVGEIMWLATTARPDIAFAAQVLARYLNAPSKVHCLAVKRVIRYLLFTQNIGLNYSRSNCFEPPTGYCDADWGRDPGDRRSVSGYVFTLANGAIDWKVKRQLVVALSTAEAEYLSASQATREAIWLRNFFSEIDRSHHDQVSTIFTDNQAAINMSLNPVQHNRTKHIDIPVHHVRDEVKKGRVCFKHIPGSENPSDIFTKPLPRDAHFNCMRAIGMF